ncbi:MAG: cobalamin-dependent protein [Elusimicrobiales bacterium]|nr:cobalamin-dependent protein [Elusimicrobiales bacterium]
MKVLFVHNGYESLGIEYLSAALKAAGHEVRLVMDPCLFDEAGFWRVPALARLFSFREAALRQAEAFRPDFAAFSVFTDTLPWALEMALEIKARTGARVIFGGIHPSAAPEAVLREHCVDYVCLGEGDLALPALLAAPEGPLPAGIWARKDGRIIKGPPPAPPAALDALPRPDKTLFEAAAPVFSSGYLVSTSRGCPHACAYCCNSVYRELYKASGVPALRRRSPENVAAELLAAGPGPGFVHFTDEVFNSDYAWLDRFLPLYAKTVKLPFSCFVFPDARLAELAPRLAAAGCFKVQLGVQRFDEKKRAALLGRRAANADIAAAIKALRAAGIYVTCDNILDLPDESEAELAALAAFYAEHPPDHNEIFFLRLYPGTPLLAAAGPARPAPGGLMLPAGYSPLPPARQRAWASLLTLLPRLPAAARRFCASRPGLFRAAGGLPLRVAARLLSRPAHDFHTLRFGRLYLRYVIDRLFLGR